LPDLRRHSPTRPTGKFQVAAHDEPNSPILQAGDRAGSIPVDILGPGRGMRSALDGGDGLALVADGLVELVISMRTRLPPSVSAVSRG
jgi:hypothetical protein